MAQDSSGKAVAIGDWLRTTNRVVRVIGLRETTKGTTATGAYVSLSDGGVRVKRFTFDPAVTTLVLKSDGTAV